MNIWRDSFDDESERSALAIVRQLDTILAPLLIEFYGEDVRPVEAAEPSRVFKSYTVEDFGFHCRIGLALHDDTAAALTAVICVGRLYRGFRKALRWLANNRASSTVAFAFDDQHTKESELWLCSTRITTPDDSAGLRAALKDIHDELGRVDAGLRMWFPQTLRGQMLTELEELAQNDGELRSFLAAPHRFLRHSDGDMENQIPALLLRDAYGWLCQWEEQLQHIDCVACESAPEWMFFLWCRARPFLEIGRYDELIELCDELEKLSNESELPSVAGIRAQAHYEKGEFEEVLDVLRSATLDTAARVCLIRSLAHARLGNRSDAIEAYIDYELLAGNDTIAAKKLSEVLPDQDSEFELV